MPTTRCPQCRKKIDTSFYAACIDCGILLSEAETADPAPSRQAGRHTQPEVGASETDISVTDPSEVAEPPLEPPDSPSMAGRVASGIGAGLLVRLVFAGLIVGGGALWGAFTAADRDAQGLIAEAGTLDPNELQVGDCLDWPGSTQDEVDQFDSVDARPCTDPHDLEVFATVEYPSAAGVPYPGDDWITDYGFGECLNSFEPYIGQGYDRVPDIDITIFWPSEEAWDNDDRTIHCLLFPVNDGVKLFRSLLGRDA